MICQIISLQKREEFQKLASAALPAAYGQMQVLPGHAESFLKLQAGTVVLKNKKRHLVPITGGIGYIKDDKILIIQ